jgi:hypothetical protein
MVFALIGAVAVLCAIGLGLMQSNMMSGATMYRM